MPLRSSADTRPTTLVLLSGGLDSAACAHWLKHQSHDLACLFVNYGQPAHRHEGTAAQAVACHLNLPLSTVSCSGFRIPPEGEIMGRNLFLLSAALMHLQRPTGLIATGIHAHTPYYDCSVAFVGDAQRLLDGYTGGRLRLVTPFLTWSKADIWRYCITSGMPVNATYSCERGTAPPCGQCRSCLDRERLNGSNCTNIHAAT
jgi:7-cyano-7-deazaguanine synthase